MKSSHYPKTFNRVETFKDKGQSKRHTACRCVYVGRKSPCCKCHKRVFAFPRYCSAEDCKADYASNTLNKWLRKYVLQECVVHSFRHSIRDRLRAERCPSDMIDQIGGWSAVGVGQGYGQGYGLGQICEVMRRLGLN